MPRRLSFLDTISHARKVCHADKNCLCYTPAKIKTQPKKIFLRKYPAGRLEGRKRGIPTSQCRWKRNRGESCP
jgi:hypothetical protein